MFDAHPYVYLRSLLAGVIVIITSLIQDRQVSHVLMFIILQKCISENMHFYAFKQVRTCLTSQKKCHKIVKG